MSIFEMLAQQPQEQAFCGITIGIVTDIKDPDKKNRVKVRLLNRSDSTQETDFIRVMTPMSGKQYGMFFLPEVGDEVLVGFVDGDFSDPYVLGSLWNTKAPAPVTVQDVSSLVVDSVRVSNIASGICRRIFRFSSEGFPPI